MELKEIAPQPQEPTYDLTGLTREQALFLRDLTGMFSCNKVSCPGEPQCRWPHAHAELYAEFERVVGHHSRHRAPRRFRFTAFTADGRTEGESVLALQCKLTDER